jgi:hypothetical protein
VLLSPEFQETQLTSAAATPRADNRIDHSFFYALGFPQPAKGPGYIERFASAEQAADLADGSPRVVEEFKDPFIQRLGRASRLRRHPKTHCSGRELPSPAIVKLHTSAALTNAFSAATL